ncbi:MAG: hypothetical protein AAFW47_04630 [Pseudomonadota bacterium]
MTTSVNTGQKATRGRSTATKKRTAKPKNPQMLKRTGQKPLQFDGALLLCETSHRPGPSMWYEVNLFGCADNTFVLQIVAFKKSDKENNMHRAWSLATIDEVLDTIESYDPSDDIEPSIGPASDMLGGSSLALRTLLTLQQIEEARSEFASLSGDVMMDLSEKYELAA